MSSISDQVRAAKNPQEALLVIAEGLDRVLERLAELTAQPVDDGWGEWPEPAEPEAPPFEITIEKGETEIVFREPSPEKYQRRLLFAQEVLQLDQQNLERYGIEEPFEVYAKGGPLWLYHGNRELFMSYSPDVRAMMVMDINEDHPETAQSVGRDVLKDEDGITKAFVLETINGSIPD